MDNNLLPQQQTSVGITTPSGWKFELKTDPRIIMMLGLGAISVFAFICAAKV